MKPSPINLRTSPAVIAVATSFAASGSIQTRVTPHFNMRDASRFWVSSVVGIFANLSERQRENLVFACIKGLLSLYEVERSAELRRFAMIILCRRFYLPAVENNCCDYQNNHSNVQNNEQ